MFKRFILWLIPLIALLLIAVCLVLSPITHTFAVSPRHTHTIQFTAPGGGLIPDYFFRP